MHQKFDKSTEKAVKLASEIAREYELDYVGTEHILLGIRREGSGLGSRILEDRGISEARIKEEIDRLISKSMHDTWVFGRLPGSPHFRNVIAEALEQAKRLESKELRTEHLLLALLREEGSVAFKALRALGCKFEDVEAEVLRQTAA